MKLAIVLNDDFSLWRFRHGLMATLVRQGHQLTAVTPYGPYVPQIEALGVTHVSIPMYRFFSPFRDILLFFRLLKLFQTNKFDLVHTITIKPNIYGAMAARLAGVKTVAGNIEGLGFLFSEDMQCASRGKTVLAVMLYRMGLRCCNRVWFVNRDDLNLFLARKILAPHKAVLIRSMGINVEEFVNTFAAADQPRRLRQELGIEPDDLVVTMVTARMVWSKGVREFVEAAQRLSQRPGVKFLLIGPIEKDSPEAVPEAYLQNQNGGNLRILPTFRTDTKELMALSDIVVLPSYYREGVPRVLLEALALSKPVVTTQNVGCREAVDEGVNGYLVPVRDSGALAAAIDRLLEDGERRTEFGRNSLRKVQAEFAETMVINRVLQELYRIA
jgi:N,N'-diacetylbacillosaminyl-diphospho-undecaprenol alpha-1,3-N-acetylgalactosaminyltransferase